MMHQPLLHVEKQEYLQLLTPRNRRVVSGMDILLGILQEGSKESRKVQAVNQFSLSLLKDLETLVKGAIGGMKLRELKMYRSYQ